jgi:hypothetical protein
MPILVNSSGYPYLLFNTGLISSLIVDIKNKNLLNTQ